MAENEIGYLIVTLTHSQRTYPVKNAEITIFNSDGVFITSAITDSSGRTERIGLAAPSLSLSLKPQETPGLAAYYYTIKVRADYFEPVTVNGIPVYSGITSLEAIDMTYSSALNGSVSDITDLEPTDL